MRSDDVALAEARHRFALSFRFLQFGRIRRAAEGVHEKHPEISHLTQRRSRQLRLGQPPLPVRRL